MDIFKKKNQKKCCQKINFLGNPVPLHDGVLEVRQVRAVVVLLHQLEKILQEAAEFLVLDGAVAVLQRDSHKKYQNLTFKK